MRRHFKVLGLYAVITLVLTFPLVFQIASHVPIVETNPGIPTGDGEPWGYLTGFDLYRENLINRHSIYIETQRFFYPVGYSFTWVTVIQYVFFLSFLLHPFFSDVVIYNLLYLSAFALGGYGAFLLSRYLGIDPKWSFIAGFIFAFNPFRFGASMGSLDLHNAQWLPFFILFFLRCADRRSLGDALAASGFFFLSTVSAAYYAVYLALFQISYLAYTWFREREKVIDPRFIKLFMIMNVVAFLLILPFVYPIVKASFNGIDFKTPLSWMGLYSLDLVSLVTPSLFHPLWGNFIADYYQNIPGYLFISEEIHFPGYLVLGLWVAGFLYFIRSKRFLLWSILSLVFFLLALGPNLMIGHNFVFHLAGKEFSIPVPFYRILDMIPFVNFSRVPNRILFMTFLFVGIVVAALLHQKTGGWTSRKQWVCFGITFSILFFEYLPWPLPTLPAKVNPVFHEIAQDRREGSLLDIPLGGYFPRRYMYHQTVHRKNLLRLELIRNVYPFYITMGEAYDFVRGIKYPEYGVTLELKDSDAETFVDLGNFWDLRHVVIHKKYLNEDQVRKFDQWVSSMLPVNKMVEDDELIAYKVLWNEKNEIVGTDQTRPRSHFLFGVLAPEMEDGRRVHWSTPNRLLMSLYIPPPVTDLELVMEMKPHPAAMNERKIKIQVNEKSLDVVNLKTGWNEYRILVPATYLKPGVNQVYMYYSFFKDAEPGYVGHNLNLSPRSFAISRVEWVPKNNM